MSNSLTEQLDSVRKEITSTSFFLNQTLAEKSALQQQYNSLATKYKTPAELEAKKEKRVKLFRKLTLIDIVITFIGFSVVLWFATDMVKNRELVTILTACTAPFFLGLLILLSFCDIKGFSQLDYEHEHRNEVKSKGKIKKPNKAQREIQVLITAKNQEYYALKNQLSKLTAKEKELVKLIEQQPKQ